MDTPRAYLREPDGIHPQLDHPAYTSTALRHPAQPLDQGRDRFVTIKPGRCPQPTRETVFFAI